MEGGKAMVVVEEVRIEVLTPKEVAGVLRLSLRTTYRYIREGLIPSFRVGRSIRVRREDLDAWSAGRA